MYPKAVCKTITTNLYPRSPMFYPSISVTFAFSLDHVLLPFYP